MDSLDIALKEGNDDEKFNAVMALMPKLRDYFKVVDKEINTNPFRVMLEEMALISQGNKPTFIKQQTSNKGRPVNLPSNYHLAHLVAEIDLKGKFIKEISIERALQNEYRPIVSRTYEKGPNSSIYYLCIPGEIPVNQNVIGNNIGRIEGEFYTYNIVSTKREQTRLTPNQNAYGTLVYVPETGHYIYYGLHNKGDLDNDFERTPFHGFFISEYDQNGSLINHSQHIAPTTEEFEDSDLNSRLKGGFGRQMKLEINDDGSYRFKVWTNKDIYIAELNSKLELLEYNLYVLDINALASSTLGDLALYPESHPINNYLNSLGEELFLDLASISYIHSFQSSPGKEILLHLTDVDNPENISLLLFSEN